MQRFLQFRLGCHGLPIAGWLAGAGHVDRANRVCLTCNSGALGNEKHMIFECTALAPLRQQRADLSTPRTDTMRSFLAQQDHLEVETLVTKSFRQSIAYKLSKLDGIGTSTLEESIVFKAR